MNNATLKTIYTHEQVQGVIRRLATMDIKLHHEQVTIRRAIAMLSEANQYWSEPENVTDKTYPSVIIHPTEGGVEYQCPYCPFSSNSGMLTIEHVKGHDEIRQS